MFGIGLPELILILIVALLVVGPKKLPELARSLGKALHDVKSMADDVKQSFVGDTDLESDLEGKAVAKPGNEPETDDKKVQKAADIGEQPPEKPGSGPYGDLRG